MTSNTKCLLNHRRLSLLLLFLGLCPSAAAISLGLSVENRESNGEWDIAFGSVLRQGYAERYVVASSNNDVPLATRLFVDGLFAEWISFEPANFTIPPKSHVRFAVHVRPPGDVPNGNYTGLITVKAFPDKASSELGMAVGAAVALKTRVEISDEQILRYEITGFATRDTEEGSPVEAVVGVLNKGNVQARFLLSTEILDQSGTVLNSAEFADIAVKPASQESAIRAIPSDGLKPGSYRLRFKATDSQGVLLREDVKQFEILEKGSFRTLGKLAELEGPAWTKLGDLVKITAVFENVGELRTLAFFEGDAGLDGRVVDLLKSEEHDVAAGDKAVLVSYFKPKEPGRYVVKGLVRYHKKATAQKEAVINVQPEAITGMAVAEIGKPASPYWLGAVALGAFIALFLLVRRRAR
ncbi:hypothetical protein HY642_00950 [Candidatus Woesearchaeota archaeon]|nr:hypothetical protein [Candidatus Woesearchaeota archaeon]